MKIAFIHYHLKTGGVTTCIKQQFEALKDDCRMCVLSGEPPPVSFPVETIHIPQLAYTDIFRKPYRAADVAAEALNRIRDHFDGPCDIIHVHNPLLAKNKQFLDILKALQKGGANLLLQVHDFAEDGRARLYYDEAYPANCHYAVVNSRDYQILLNCGLKKMGVHRLFNCVSTPGMPSYSMMEGTTVVYPIRAIRRKNIGEAILLSLFFSDKAELSITLPPNSAVDMASYKGWKTFSRNYDLRIAFDSGLKQTFESIVGSARALLTTSITEGFGYSYLEPWLFGKMIRGRKLPDICSDFESRGIDLSHMYTQLQVPDDWFDSKRFNHQWFRAVEKNARIFGFQMDLAKIKRTFAAITEDGMIDFGLLAEPFQRQVLSHLLSHEKHAKRLLSINPFLSTISDSNPQSDIIESNRDAIVRYYSIAGYRQNLLNIYQQVLANPVQQKIDRKRLISEFFDLRRFSLLKWGEDDLR
jgi:hypothetical protein